MENTKKWVFIIIFILSIIGGIILIYNSREKHFNKIELNKNNYILNKTDMEYIDTVLSVGLDELDISGVSIYARGITINNNIGELTLLGHIIAGENNQYLIEINPNNKSEIIKIVSHELIHLQQMKTGKFKVTKTYVLWKGDTLYNPPPYEEREWELEAVEKGLILEKQINSVLYNKK